MDNSKRNNLIMVYLLGFLLSFHVAIPNFINSSFLDTLLSEKYIGMVYTTASLLTIFLLFFIPFLLKKNGNYYVSLFFLLLESLTLICLVLSTNSILSILFFSISLICIPIIYFVSDIFLEGFSTDYQTGKIRGIYLTLMNLAWVISPLIGGLILTNNNYKKIYFISFLFLLPIIVIILKLRKFKDPIYESTFVFGTLKRIWRDHDIRNILSSNFLLNFFYSWMTIFTPLYLHKYMNYSWSEIGIIFTIMLIPFVLIQFPLGKLADEKLGEKEILSIGFIIIIFSTLGLYFIPNNSVWWIWAILLFITRVGAGSVEIMNNTYFFKKVSSLDANLISFLGVSRSLAYIFGPLAMSFFLFLFTDPKQLFLILSLIMFFGLYFSFGIKDTK